MHGTTARHHEHVLYALCLYELDDVIRKLHGISLRVRGATATRAAKIISTSSRTAPCPPLRMSTRATAALTGGCAFAGATLRPAISSAGRSFTSSPMKAMRANAVPVD